MKSLLNLKKKEEILNGVISEDPLENLFNNSVNIEGKKIHQPHLTNRTKMKMEDLWLE